MTSFPLTGAILAGGQSLRMGQPKEGVVMPDGRQMIEHLIEPLSQVCKQIVIVGACRGFIIRPESALLHLPDTTPGMGPLAAIAALLQSGIDKDGYIVSACDQPYITADLLRLLAQKSSDLPSILQPIEGEILTPFPGYYPVLWLLEIEKQLQAGERSICRALQESRVTYIPFPKEWKGSLRNLNTPTDLLQTS